MSKKICIPNTDLSLFPLGLGTAAAGAAWTEEETFGILDAFVENGGNFVDTAHVYSDWIPGERNRSERIIGDWLQSSKKRDHIILATKGGHPDMTVPNPDMHKSRMTPEEIREDLESSLKALKTDVIDLYFYHRDNPAEKVDVYLDLMENFREEGKIRYYACSNWSTARMQEADAYCRKMNYRGFAANEALYNPGSAHMLPMDDDTLEIADEAMLEFHRTHPDNLLMAYMSVCSGFFHKYLSENPAAKKMPYYTEENIRLAEKMKELCEKRNLSVTQAVLGYFQTCSIPCLPLYGPKNVEQILEAMKTMDCTFTAEDYKI